MNAYAVYLISKPSLALLRTPISFPSNASLALIRPFTRFPETHIVYTNFLLAFNREGEPVGSCSCYGQPYNVSEESTDIFIMLCYVLLNEHIYLSYSSQHHTMLTYALLIEL